MKRFIKNFLFVIAILLIALTVCDVALCRRIQQSSQREYQSWNAIMQGEASSDVIVMGSSRAWAQFSPQILDSLLGISCYNIGIDGSSINRQIDKYSMYRIYNKKPKIILQNIDFWTIDITKGYEKHQYFPYFWNSDFRRVVFKNEPFTLAEKIIPFYRFSHYGIKNLFKEQCKVLRGYCGLEYSWDGSKLNDIDSIVFSPSQKASAMFEEYLSKAQEEGVQVILVYAPVYSEATSRITNIAEMYQYYANIANRYGAKIIDFNSNSICNDTAYFYNATHLNKLGSELFSTELADSIKTVLQIQFPGSSGVSSRR